MRGFTLPSDSALNITKPSCLKPVPAPWLLGMCVGRYVAWFVALVSEEERLKRSRRQPLRFSPSLCCRGAACPVRSASLLERSVPDAPRGCRYKVGCRSQALLRHRFRERVKEFAQGVPPFEGVSPLSTFLRAGDCSASSARLQV